MKACGRGLRLPAPAAVALYAFRQPSNDNPSRGFKKEQLFAF